MKYKSLKRGFTLVELLVVVAIIGVLVALIIPCVGMVRKNAAGAVEVAAAREMLAAYLVNAADHGGQLMAAVDSSVVSTTVDEGGLAPTSVPAARWPFHLLPYLDNRFKGSLYVNQQAAFYDNTVKYGGTMRDYYLSLFPSLGMNGGFVGRVVDTGLYPQDTDRPVQRVAQAVSPSGLIVFVSAHDRATGASLASSLQLPDQGQGIGYFAVVSPNTWPSANITGDPSDTSLDASYGYVAYRYDGKAVTGFLDGHVELKACAELRDMRLWSNQARLNGNANYVPGGS